MAAWLNEADRTEARRLCAQARRLLQQAYEQAQSARNWGIYDMLGGGVVSSIVKHNRIDSAQTYLNQAQPILQRLGALMQQQGLTNGLADNAADGFTKVIDIGFDNIFTDLFVQGKISDMKSSIEIALGKLNALERQL